MGALAADARGYANRAAVLQNSTRLWRSDARAHTHTHSSFSHLTTLDRSREDPLKPCTPHTPPCTQSRSDGLWLPTSHITRRDALRFSAGAAAAATAAPGIAHAAQGRDLPSLAQKAPEGNSVKLSNGGGDFPLMSFGLQVLG